MADTPEQDPNKPAEDQATETNAPAVDTQTLQDAMTAPSSSDTALPTTTNDQGTQVVADADGKPVEGAGGEHIEVDPQSGIPVTKDEGEVVVADPQTGDPAKTDGETLPLADATTTTTEDGQTVVAHQPQGDGEPVPFTDNNDQPIPVADQAPAPSLPDAGLQTPIDPASDAAISPPTDAGAPKPPEGDGPKPPDGSLPPPPPSEPPPPPQDGEVPPPKPPGTEDLPPPPIDGNPTEPSPPIPSAASDSKSEGEDAGTSSDPTVADSPNRTGLKMGHDDISEHPTGNDSLEMDTTTGKPFGFQDTKPVDGLSEPQSAEPQPVDPAAAEPTEAAPSAPVAAPTAGNLDDVFCGLTPEGADFFSGLEEFSENAGAALLAEVKAGANYATSIIAKLNAGLEEHAFDGVDERHVKELLHAFKKVEKKAHELFERDVSQVEERSADFSEKVIKALRGVEDAVRETFSKLIG